VPAGAEAFWEPFLVAADGHWSGQYFWAQPALLALGLAAHAVYLVPALEVACTVVFTHLLVGEWTADRRAAALAALLVATSPIVVMTGGTLLNANLSAACGAASLYALARIGTRAGSERSASVTLGLATAIGLHNRVLDQAALLGAAGAVLFVARRDSGFLIARRLLPAVAIAVPFLALHPFLNAAVSGDWRHSGYWLYYQGHDWISFGFGRGPGDFPQSGATAAAKTIANGVRMLFYACGGPLAFVPVGIVACLPDVATPASRGLLRAGGWIVCLYYAAYFFYASAPITVTGPVYFDALVPVLAGSVAVAALALHDATADLALSRRRRIVPAFALAQTVAAFVFFWPGALGEVRREAKDAAACDDLARTLDPAQRALVFVAPAETYASWTFWRPMPSPRLDDRVLFTRSGAAAADATVASRFGVDRAIYFARCVAAPEARIEHYDPVSEKRAPM
jgi:hypothetical protein